MQINPESQNSTSILQSPFKSPKNNPQPSSNYYEGLTTTEQNDQIYLTNMELSKLQNSNLSNSGSFAPAVTNNTKDNLSLSSFHLSNSHNEEENLINNSNITLRDLNVTPYEEINNKVTNNNDIELTPVSTMCNYYLQSESNRKSKNKKNEFIDTKEYKTTINFKNYFDTSKKNNNVEKILNVNRKINFNKEEKIFRFDNNKKSNRRINTDNNNNYNNHNISFSKKKESSKYSKESSKEEKKHIKLSSNKNTKDKDNNKKSNIKSNSISKNKTQFNYPITIETVERFCGSLNKKEKSLSLSKKNNPSMKQLNNKRTILNENKKHEKSNSKENNPPIRKNSQTKKPKSQYVLPQNKKDIYNNIKKIKIDIYKKNAIPKQLIKNNSAFKNSNHKSNRSKSNSRAKESKKTNTLNKIPINSYPYHYSTVKKEESKSSNFIFHKVKNPMKKRKSSFSKKSNNVFQTTIRLSTKSTFNERRHLDSNNNTINYSSRMLTFTMHYNHIDTDSSRLNTNNNSIRTENTHEYKDKAYGKKSNSMNRISWGLKENKGNKINAKIIDICTASQVKKTPSVLKLQKSKIKGINFC